jgi:hypothetical protein
MSIVTTDIDIDFADPRKALEGLTHVPAMMTNKKGESQRHPSGVYFQNVPKDPLTGLCALDYDQATELGYFKIDFLSNTLYEGVRDEDHLIQLLDAEPDWSLLDHQEIVSDLAHIHSHFGVVQAIRPKSIEDLAVVLALMRPGKKHLLGRSRAEIDAEIWDQSQEGFTFKRAHAIAYAASIIVQLNLICERIAQAIDLKKASSAGDPPEAEHPKWALNEDSDMGSVF